MKPRLAFAYREIEYVRERANIQALKTAAPREVEGAGLVPGHRRRASRGRRAVARAARPRPMTPVIGAPWTHPWLRMTDLCGAREMRPLLKADLNKALNMREQMRRYGHW